jgi:hypothetical protein
MIKYAPLALFLFIFQLHAMEIIKQNPSILCDDVCYLNQMPREILDCIASFLMETEEEFIERVRRENVEEQEERKEKLKEPVNDVGIIRMLMASNIDATKALLFMEQDCELTLYDYINPDEGYLNTQYSYKEEREIGYISIAVSSKGRMLARYFCEDTEDVVLEIIKIDTQKKEDGIHILMLQESRELYRGDPLCISSIVFNQQGNKLIAYDRDSDFEPTIFPLKGGASLVKYRKVDITKSQELVKITAKPQVTAKTTNKLQEYLRDKCVCNTYIEGKK